MGDYREMTTELRALDAEERSQPEMTMSMFLATEGGRKFPMCGKYAKKAELGNLGGTIRDENGKWLGHISAYGHLPGFGCNGYKKAALSAVAGGEGK
jgi:hypothetical protein